MAAAGSTVLIRRPTAPNAPDVSAPSYTLDKPLAGTTIGLRTDNAWRSWRIIAEVWKDKLEAAGAKTVQVDGGGQTGKGRVRDKKTIEDFAGVVDGAFIGLGTCGSCTSFTITDAVEVEDQAKASVAVVTTEFEAHGHNVATFLGHRDLKVLVMPYPLEALPEDELHDIAERYWPQALDLLGVTG